GGAEHRVIVCEEQFHKRRSLDPFTLSTSTRRVHVPKRRNPNRLIFGKNGTRRQGIPPQSARQHKTWIPISGGGRRGFGGVAAALRPAASAATRAPGALGARGGGGRPD